MNSKNRKTTEAGKADPLNSEYKQKIFLVGKDRPLTGYSKGQGFNESGDRTYALAAFILRMFQNGYFNPQRVERIEYYRWNKDSMTHSDFILTIYPTEFSYSNDQETRQNERLAAWLKMLYTSINSGKPIEASKLMMQPQRIEVENLFSLSYRRFETETALNTFCQMLQRKGYAQDRIHNFYVKYREKFTFNPTPEELKQLTEKFSANR